MRLVVVSPFLYTKEKHDEVRKKISQINQSMNEQKEDYILIVPGRLGSTNRDWGLQIDYRDVDKAVAIFEFGVDISGRSEPLDKDISSTGSIYGSHFLYMIQGGYNEAQKRLQTRIYGTQGTHFLTNLVSNNIIYGFIAPKEDNMDQWFFSPASKKDPLYVLAFQQLYPIHRSFFITFQSNFSGVKRLIMFIDMNNKSKHQSCYRNPNYYASKR